MLAKFHHIIPIVVFVEVGSASAIIHDNEIINYFILYNKVLMTDREALLKGEIVFVENINSLTNATIYVRLEDVTLMDAPSKIISEQVIKNVNYDPTKQDKIKFVIYGEIVNTEASYSLSVHIDVDLDGKLSSGDFINMESFPVLTRGNPDNISVRVKQIK